MVDGGGLLCYLGVPGRRSPPGPSTP